MTTIDAENKTLGRVASAAAKILLGKHKPTFAKNAVMGEEITIINASKVIVSGSKSKDKKYIRYSGYPGGKKEESYTMLVRRRGHKEAIRRAVMGMLPKNKLQVRRIKLLKIDN
ncbi:50S ribosomal protein L13 [Candidatus Adlerbacteria bacterium RIFCSPHIGHO2_01_FULL_54_23]|uniref:Large ribosomal subunit protein uL13 n=3 Tax=Candidatus Adleribacteriota TaxID=1752736 RepID=A0A1F4Y0Y4_9BACT|nr:MAG: 50S ribosomal protein L13 [Candidatus Adlerbacteria bacterium GW2011_GWA1_54_10]KKW37972.1 MAG: 50S ribosomal protein L13 [Candidatus Adlerbacteria bacterium GW2011_GWB1_54_7]OGC78580.1 MAG: 50S ribosomal protein L13 [Candidatus Adlerbacteria bacterium RIFCSPHIGHO2_01_FULL_54_23]OGC87589.1 MAG: 50S ribosomal protein L13 [Candidatus Adlerbacteria bacterium RIFCSPLOWO2_01_FULL_54_16]